MTLTTENKEKEKTKTIRRRTREKGEILSLIITACYAHSQELYDETLKEKEEEPIIMKENAHQLLSSLAENTSNQTILLISLKLVENILFIIDSTIFHYIQSLN
jgi:hypothetical protein